MQIIYAARRPHGKIFQTPTCTLTGQRPISGLLLVLKSESMINDEAAAANLHTITGQTYGL